MQKSGVVLGVHDAEADVFAVQAFEGGAVADHETLVDAGVEDVLGGQAGLLDFQEEEVGVGRVGFVSGDILQGMEQTVTFGKDELPGVMNIVFIF